MTFLDADIPCPNCGYNLRGLPSGNACPECGLKAPFKLGAPDLHTVERLDAEFEDHLKQQEKDARLDQLIAAWEERGRRFDQLLDRMEKLLDRVSGGS